MAEQVEKGNAADGSEESSESSEKTQGSSMEFDLKDGLSRRHRRIENLDIDQIMTT
jgi:hypothetical protein